MSSAFPPTLLVRHGRNTNLCPVHSNIPSSTLCSIMFDTARNIMAEVVYISAAADGPQHLMYTQTELSDTL